MGESKKIVIVPDPPVFEGKADGKAKEISYHHWLLQMRNKMTANKRVILTELLKKAYVPSRVSGNALGQLEPRHLNSTRPLATANEMLDTLTSAFADPDRKQTARTRYQTLWQGDRDFSDLWPELQRLAAELDHSEETLIDDFIEKYHYTIQQQLATGEEEPTSVIQLAKRCQRIELSLKKGCRNKIAQERYSARKADPTATRTTSAAPASNTQLSRVSQPRIKGTTADSTAPSATNLSKLTEDDRAKLVKFGRCFKRKQEGHTLLDCTQPFQPFSTVSTLLHKVTLVKDNAAEMENE